MDILAYRVTDTPTKPTQVQHTLYLLAGHVLLGIGFIGMWLPVMPTTVFWIAAAACYAKGSPGHYQRLVQRGRIGANIKNYLEHGVISPQGKVAASLGMMLSGVVLYLLPLGDTALLFGLAGLAVGILYVITRSNRIAKRE